MDQDLLKEIQNIFNSGRTFLILTHKDPTLDAIAASLALSQGISQAGKITSVACPTPLTVEFSSLFGVDKIETKIGNKNFVISLDYVEGSIEKVSYNVEGNKFNLIIQPKNGFPSFSADKVHYSRSGLNADAVFIVDTQELQELSPFYPQEKEIFEKIPLLNLDYHPNNNYFGKINLVKKNSSSCSEIILALLQFMSLPIDIDCATNVLTGIEAATNSFKSQNTNAETFEAAATCLKKGAKRIYVSPTQSKTTSNGQVPFISKTKPSLSPPPDWLQPKIYKGGQLL